VTASRPDLARFVPPMAEILDRVAAMVAPLRLTGLTHLGAPEADQAQAALARLYWKLGRYAEAAATLREAWVNRYAALACTRPGAPTCTKEQREKAEKAWYVAPLSSTQAIAAVRNDIEHAGFRSDPLPPASIRKQLDRLIKALEDSAQRRMEPTQSAAAVTYFVTRHPGARDWAAEEGVQVDQVLEHLDTDRIQPGDTVIGSLPVNLAAEVCARGGRYLHLSLDLTREQRGKELTAEELRFSGARLEAYRVERLGG
jgi:CRISPR-associated protein Csx16